MSRLIDTDVAGRHMPIATNTSQRIAGTRARRKGEPMNDLISRQAAIDAADNMVEPQESEDKE